MIIIITLCYDVTELYDTWILRVRYGMRRTQPACLVDAAEFSDTRSSPVEASKHSKFNSNNLFNLPILLKLASKTNWKWPILAHL